MNKQKILWIVVAVVAVLAIVGGILLFTGGDADGHACENKCETCGKCTDENCTDSVCKEKCTCSNAVTLSGLVGEGYTFTAEGYTVTDDGKLEVRSGTEVKLTLVLGANYYSGTPVVKLDGNVLEGADSVYTCKVTADGTISVEGLLLYEMIIRNPLNVSPDGTTAEELGTPMSEASNIITAGWKAEGYSFANVRLERYLAICFYVKADNAWIAFRDNLGEFNELDTPIYANGVKNEATGENEPDSQWRKYEFIRETADDGSVSYRLYVDGVMHTHYDAENEVDARIKTKLADFLVDINGTYYVSELFGCLDPEYASQAGSLEIYAQTPFVTPQDDYSTENYPCEESIRVNVYARPQWGKEQLISLPLAPYQEVKFYISCPSSGWIVGHLNGKDVAIFASGTGWHEFLIQKEGDKFALYVDGQITEEYLGFNLNELEFILNDATYYVSELFVLGDPNYVPPNYEAVTSEDPMGQPSNVVEGDVPAEYVEDLYKLIPGDWTNAYFEPLNALQYKELKFFAKGPGEENKWLQIALGGNDLLATNDGEWHEMTLVKANGGVFVYVDGVQKAKVTNLAQLRLVMTGGGTYYYTDVYGVKDENYVPVTLKAPKGEGYRIEFVDAYAENDVAVLEKGSNVSFRVILSLDYDQSNYTVQIGGTTVEAVDGIFTATVNGDATISVYGVKENPNSFVHILDHPFELVGEETTDILPEGFDQVTKLTTTWNRYSFKPVNLNKYLEVRFAVYSSGWFGIMDGDVVIDETTGDGQWLRIRLVKVDGGWQLFYNEKDEGILVLPYNNLSDLGFRFGDNTYYVTELKGLENPNYTDSKPAPDPDEPADPFQQALNHPFVLDGSITDDVMITGYDQVTKLTTTWNKYNFKPLDLTPYIQVKFAVKSSGWYGVMYNDTVIDETTNHGAWLEIKLVRETGGWRLYYGEKDQGLLSLPSNNLTDLNFRFGDNTYYVTELRTLDDPDYVKPEFELIADSNPINVEAEVSDVLPNADFVTGSWKFEPDNWTSTAYNALNVLPYEQVKFYVKSDGPDSKWIVLQIGATPIMQANDTAWHEVCLKKVDGYMQVIVDGTQEGVLTDLAQLAFIVNEGTAYYYTGIYGIADEAYEGVTLTVPSGTGYSVNVDTAYVSGGVAALEKGSVVTFRVGLDEQYNQSTVVVKANGTLIEAVDGVYTLTVSQDVAITVEGVVANPVIHDPVTDWSSDETGHWHDCNHCSDKLDFAEHTPGDAEEEITKEPTATEAGSKDIVVKCTVCGYEISRTSEEIPATSSGYVTVVTNPVNNTPTSTTTEGLPSVDVTIVNITNCNWTSPGLVDGITMADWTELKLYYKVSDAGKWFEMYDAASNALYQGNSTTWTEIKFVLEGDVWTLYVGGEWKKSDLTGTTLKDIVATLTFGGGVTADVYVTDLVGIPAEEEEPESTYSTVVSNPLNNTPTSTTTENLPSADVTVVNITNCNWTSPGLVDGITMADWTELKLYYKVSDAGKWFEMYDASDAALYQGNATEWTEIKFVLEGDVWTLYVGGEWKKSDLTGTTLKDIVAKVTLGGGVTADVYVTDLVGIPAETQEKPSGDVTITANPFDIAGEASTEAAPEGYESVTVFTTSWNKYNFVSTDLTAYAEVRFAVKSSGWYGVMTGDSVINETDGSGNWLEIKLVKAATGWEVYYGGVLQQTVTLPNNNLTDLNFRFGSNTYYVTELKGTLAQEEEDEPTTDVTITANPFDIAGEASTEAAPEGYESVTMLTTSWNKYNFVSTDMKLYTEVRFAVKSSGWYGLMSGDSVINETHNDGQWLEIKLVKAATGWEVYYGGVLQQTVTLPNNNLTDLNFRFGSNTYYVTELKGVEAEPPVELTVMDHPFALTGEAETVEAAPEGYESVTKFTTTWNKYNFASLDLTPYLEVRFQVKSNGWYGVMADGTNVINETNGSGNWLEIKLVKAATGWDLYYGDVFQQSLTISGNNLAGLNFRFGDNTYYVTEVKALQPADYEDPTVTIVENPFDIAGEASTEAAPKGYESVTALTTSWNKYNFVSTDLTQYTQVWFAVKSSGWYGLMTGDSVINETYNDGQWLEIKLVKAATGWEVYYGGVLQQTVALPNSNLTDLNFRFGSNTYYVTELKGTKVQ